jgi:hypothetical protein
MKAEINLTHVIIAVIVVGALIYFFGGTKTDKKTDKIEQTINEIIEPFKSEMKKDFNLQNLKLRELDSNQVLIKNKINEVIVIVKENHYKLDTIINGVGDLKQGQHRILKKLE